MAIYTLPMSQVIANIINNTMMVDDIYIIHEDKELEIYIAHKGLCEIGFKFKGAYSESSIKNTISIASWRKALQKCKDIMATCREVGWTVFADIYNKDNYTLKREKLACSLGLSPIKDSHFEVGGDNIWKLKRVRTSRLTKREFLPSDPMTKLYKDDLVEIWEEQPEYSFQQWHILYKEEWYVVFYENTIGDVNEGKIVSFIYA